MLVVRLQKFKKPDQELFTMYDPDFNVPLVWEPSEKTGRQTKRLKKIIGDKYKVKFNDYREFQRWTTDNLCEFWEEFWDFIGVISSKRFDKVIDLNVPISESPKWFEGAKLNCAENFLKYRDDRIALIQDGEDLQIETYTFSQVYEQSKLYAAAFRKFGLKKGDVVAGYMSNRKESGFAVNAVTSIGAIWTGAPSQLGSEAIVNRFKQVKPRVLLTVDRFLYGGEETDMLAKVKVAVQGLQSLEKVLVVASKSDSYSKDLSGIKNSCFLEDFLKLGVEEDGSVPEMQFEQVSFSHPIFIGFTSGTTGIPKALVRGSGILMSMTSTFGVTIDSNIESVWISLSPMIRTSNILQFLGQTVVLYDGNPSSCIWDILDKHKISHAYFPSSVVDELQKRNNVPTEKHDLSSLKYVLASGSVVKGRSYEFIKAILPHVAFSPGYGCFEVATCCLISEPSMPVYKAEMNAQSVGMAVDIVDNAGNPVIGEVGEVILSKPIPSFPLGFWGDEDGSAFREKYFSKYEGMFAMGDYGIINPLTKGWQILCRSDETLNQRGYRFGSSEIYNVVDTFSEVGDSLCVPYHNKDRDAKAVLFLKMKDGYSFSEELANRVRKAIARNLSERHVPDIIIETTDIPYNLNGKKMEITVKKIINKMPLSCETVANPESLQFYYNVPALQEF